MSPDEAKVIAEFDSQVAFMYGFAKAAKDAGLDEKQYAEVCKLAAEMTSDFSGEGTSPGFMKAMQKAQTPVKAPVISNSGTPAITNTVKPGTPAPVAPAVAPKPQLGAATSDFGVDPNTPTTDFMKQLEAQQKKTGAALRIALFKQSTAAPIQPMPPAPPAGPVPASPTQNFVSQLLSQKLKAGKPAQA